MDEEIRKATMDVVRAADDLAEEIKTQGKCLSPKITARLTKTLKDLSQVLLLIGNNKEGLK